MVLSKPQQPPMPESTAPIQPDELDGLFARFAALGPCALAVSGGSDSTALMVLYADWLRRRREQPRRCTVLTVDHGLRPSSADEARAVAATAVEIGFRHATLPWEGLKPRAGIQAAARAARYRLMGDYMHANGIALLLTAHTRDDQAETLLMRLARGSGLDGLAAMAPLTPLGGHGGDAEEGGLWIGRPFLDVPKACLRATLEVRKMRWMEDPSNIAPEFERARLRAARADLDALGLTPDMLALSAARLTRARRAVEAMVDEVCDPEAGIVSIDADCGAVLLDRKVLREMAEEVALRLLERAILAAGGGERPALGKLEAVGRSLLESRGGGHGSAASGQGRWTGRWTLARALISAEPGVVRVERELGREPLPEVTLAPGGAVLWDGRFWVSVAKAYAGGPLKVRALGEVALRDLRRRRLLAEGTSHGAATVPALWRGDEIVAVPSLGFWLSAHTRDQLDAIFLGLGQAPNAAGSGGSKLGKSSLRTRNLS